MKNKKPNVLIFFTDQQRVDTSSLYGNKEDITPNFDRMALEGTHLYNAFTCQPVCLPARSCLQTGKYASTMDIYNNGGELPKDATTLGHYFKDAGYNTAYIGKWHMCHEEPVPKERRSGYDYWMGANLMEFVSDAYETYLFDNDGNREFFPGYRVDAVTDIAIDYLKDSKDEESPFYLMVSYIEPHFQNSRDDFPAPDGYEERYQDPWTPPDLKALSGTAYRHLPGYYGMVKRLDEALGRITDALKSLDMLDDTIILYTADHSCHFKTRNSEYKRSCHESSIHIPMAITGPGFKSGGRIQDLVSLVDVPPTLLEACNIDVPKDMQGNSFKPLVDKKDINWQGDIFVEICDQNILRKCVRTKRWKYTIKAKYPIGEGDSNEYIEDQLYDLKADPWELNNIIGYESHKKVTEVMKERMLIRLKNIGLEEITIKSAKSIPSGQKTLKDKEAFL